MAGEEMGFKYQNTGRANDSNVAMWANLRLCTINWWTMQTTRKKNQNTF